MKLSERLRQGRKKLGVTLRIASNNIDISAGYLNDLEHDRASRPKIKYLVAAANFYGIDRDSLIISAGKIPPDVYFKIVNNPKLLEIIRNYEV